MRVCDLEAGETGRRMVGAAARLAALALAVGLAGPASARPIYVRDLQEAFHGLLPGRVQNCNTCHYREGDAEPRLNPDLPKPHNAFGARLKAVGDSLRAAGKKHGIQERLLAVAAEDADGDGAPNERELLLGTNPGLRAHRPTPADLRRGELLAAQLADRRRRYAWRPFERVERPSVPASAIANWANNPVDSFLAATMVEKGLRPSPPAGRQTLLRRITLDLIGVPPTPTELEAFEADDRPGAYERLVDRLLADPRYGERWARHWMDVWRYSDWDGYGNEVRNSQPHVWRWRDWIVKSLNAGKGYDRMVMEMLAGDELAPEDPDVLAATGFLVRNWYRFSRHETLNRIVEGTGKAFLGLTVNCARCHEHKYDAISMDEFYALRAVFEPYEVRLDRIPGEPDVNRAGIARVYDGQPDAETFFLLRGDDRTPDRSRKIAPAALSLLGAAALQVQPVPMPRTVQVPDRRPFVIEETRRAVTTAVEQARKSLENAAGPEAAEVARLGLAAAEASRAALLALLRVEDLEESGRKDTPDWREAASAAGRAQRAEALAVAEHRVRQAEVELEGLQRAGSAASAQKLDAAQKRLTEARGALAAAQKSAAEPMTTAYKPRPISRYPAASTGRRTALARWIASRDNPLAARVAVNHVWLRHFGTALVPSVFDFGRNGRPPSHPALLDWLAIEFMENGWNLKHLHRLIVTSAAYRMSAAPHPAGLARDPENRTYWRMNSRRAEAEAVRDSALAIAGRLDRAMGGPDLDPNSAMATTRRSLYYRHSVEKRVEFLTIFDQANVNDCYERIHTIMPQQALALANSPLALTSSRLAAASLWEESAAAGPPVRLKEFVRRAFRRLLTRDPRPEETAACLEFLAEQERLLTQTGNLEKLGSGPGEVPPSSDPAHRARESLVHSLLNHHEFVTIP